MRGVGRAGLVFASLAVFCPVMAPVARAEKLVFGPEEIVQASGSDLVVLGYSVPSVVDWDGDGLTDLIVGEGGNGYPGKIRVYLNVGAASSPDFGGSSYAQSGGADLEVWGSGCLGCFPRAVYWGADAQKDLLVGESYGKLNLFTNVGTDIAPVFDAGAYLQVGPDGSKADIDVGYRATPVIVDWNSDGRKDVVSGSYDGKMYLFLNEGTDAAPDFQAQQYVQLGSSDLVVPSYRSSPVVLDLNGDARKDLLSGNTDGQVLLYPNGGTDAAPAFSTWSYVESLGVPIDLPDTPRSRPFVGDWNGDGLLDLLLGAGDGKVRLYHGLLDGDADGDGCVDGVDLADVGLNWSPSDTDKIWADGDFDGDGDVDASDLAAVGLNWSPSGYRSGGAFSVPEPATLTLAAAGLATALLRRR